MSHGAKERRTSDLIRNEVRVGLFPVLCRPKHCCGNNEDVSKKLSSGKHFALSPLKTSHLLPLVAKEEVVKSTASSSPFPFSPFLKPNQLLWRSYLSPQAIYPGSTSPLASPPP
jgi:hypothetical protein